MKFGEYYFDAVPFVIYSAYKINGNQVALIFFGFVIMLKVDEFHGMLKLGKLHRKF